MSKTIKMKKIGTTSNMSSTIKMSNIGTASKMN
jgi:hypothetical protein